MVHNKINERKKERGGGVVGKEEKKKRKEQARNPFWLFSGFFSSFFQLFLERTRKGK
jgi:hypothetical protein